MKDLSFEKVNNDSVGKEQSDDAKDETCSPPPPRVKPLTADEYDSSLNIVKMQVKLDEVNSAVDDLNN
eukprot:3832655-Ditylum_brightwellii.AAC.1